MGWVKNIFNDILTSFATASTDDGLLAAFSLVCFLPAFLHVKLLNMN